MGFFYAFCIIMVNDICTIKNMFFYLNRKLYSKFYIKLFTSICLFNGNSINIFNRILLTWCINNGLKINSKTLFKKIIYL